jgi:NADPH2:quinone reductase
VKAIVVTRFGGPEVLELQDRPSPEPGPGELLVDVHVAGVNFRDVYERSAPGYGPGEPPFVAGIEGAGVVAAAGDGVAAFSRGDRVAWNAANGSYAEQVVVAADRAIRVPDGLQLDVACAAILQGMTAHYLTHSVYEVQRGDWVLIHAAAGGVGLLLTQIAKLRGGRVIGTTSSEEKAALASAAGAEAVLRYEEVPERVLELTADEGVAAVYDGVGQATFDGSLASLRPRGVLALYGAASGQPEPLDLGRLAAKSLFVTRPGLPRYIATPEDLAWRSGDVLGWVAGGSLDVRIGQVYPLADAPRAQEDLEARRTTGKLLLDARSPAPRMSGG